MQASTMEQAQKQRRLHEPLLGYDQEEEELSCCSFSEEDQYHEIFEDTIKDDDHYYENDHNSLFCNDTVVIWIILPSLLLSQFGMAFMLHDATTAHLSWPIVNFSIFLFVVTAWLFRHACVDSKIEMVLLLLLPEISMDVILALVLFNQVELGFVTLLASMLLLSSFVVVTTAHYLYCRAAEEEEEEADEGEEFHEEEEAAKKIAVPYVMIV